MTRVRRGDINPSNTGGENHSRFPARDRQHFCSSSPRRSPARRHRALTVLTRPISTAVDPGITLRCASSAKKARARRHRRWADPGGREGVLLLDSGDTIEDRRSRRWCSRDRSRPRGPDCSRAMNLVGYDAMAVGNHEFNFRRERLRRAQARGENSPGSRRTSWQGTGALPSSPTSSRSFAGVRVGILGLTTKNIPFWGPLTSPDSSSSTHGRDGAAVRRLSLRGRESATSSSSDPPGIRARSADGQGERHGSRETRPTRSRPRCRGSISC